MNEVLEALLHTGWVAEVAELPGGRLHVRWTEAGGAQACFVRTLFVALELGASGRAEALRTAILENRFQASSWGLAPTQETEIARFLRRLFFEMPDGFDGDAFKVFLELCVRHAPGGPRLL